MKRETTQIEMQKKEAGFGVIELLFGILIISIAGVAVMSDIVTSYQNGVRFELNYAAHALAVSKAEYFSAANIASIDSSNNSVETGLSTPGVKTTFSRTTSITVNADNSRTINIVVANETGAIDTSVDYETTFSTWQ